jgi:hypothetical protein
MRLVFIAPKTARVPCQGGWVLGQIDSSMRRHIERLTAVWYGSLGATLRQAYNNASQNTALHASVHKPEKWTRFDVFMPAAPEACPTLKRLGASGDGGKMLCGIEHIVSDHEEPCIVYSIGSNNQWDFEAAIVEATPCIVHTFDCTIDGNVPDSIQEWVTFHKICLGEATQDATGEFKTLKQIMAFLGHERITLLKADIVRMLVYLKIADKSCSLCHFCEIKLISDFESFLTIPIDATKIIGRL